MVDIFTYFAELPDGVNEMVVPGYDGYTIYIEERLSDEEQLKALDHALCHIYNKDFNKSDTCIIEKEAHNEFLS